MVEAGASRGGVSGGLEGVDLGVGEIGGAGGVGGEPMEHLEKMSDLEALDFQTVTWSFCLL